jgi:hypothetical protein
MSVIIMSTTTTTMPMCTTQQQHNDVIDAHMCVRNCAVHTVHAVTCNNIVQTFKCQVVCANRRETRLLRTERCVLMGAMYAQGPLLRPSMCICVDCLEISSVTDYDLSFGTLASGCCSLSRLHPRACTYAGMRIYVAHSATRSPSGTHKEAKRAQPVLSQQRSNGNGRDKISKRQTSAPTDQAQVRNPETGKVRRRVDHFEPQTQQRSMHEYLSPSAEAARNSSRTPSTSSLKCVL